MSEVRGAATRTRAVYRLRRPGLGDAEELARAIAREQTLEVPEGVVTADLEEGLLGRVEEFEPVAEGAFDATISYDDEITGTGLPQVLNVIWGNVSLMNGVRLVDLELSAAVLDALPGPRRGIAGLRALVGADVARPLVSVALKPVGRTTEELADLATILVRAGVDVIKDDHGLVDQAWSRFADRVRRVGAAVAEANAATGSRTAYFPNVTGPVDTLHDRLDHASSTGCTGVMVCPSLLGLDVMRAMAKGPDDLAVMAHPAHAQVAPDRHEGIAPEVLFGTLYRAAGADVVVYVNAGGRFDWPLPTCEAVNARLRAPLGSLLPSFPAPAGGVDAGEAGAWLRRYGPDTMLLIGGSLLRQEDVLGATRSVVEAARASTPFRAVP